MGFCQLKTPMVVVKVGLKWDHVKPAKEKSHTTLYHKLITDFILLKRILDSQKKTNKQTGFKSILRATDVNCTAEKIQSSLIFTGGLPSQPEDKVSDWFTVSERRRYGWKKNKHSEHIQTKSVRQRAHHYTGYEPWQQEIVLDQLPPAAREKTWRELTSADTAWAVWNDYNHIMQRFVSCYPTAPLRAR